MQENNHNQSDHDLLLVLSANTQNILTEIQNIKVSQLNLQTSTEARVRKIEDSLIEVNPRGLAKKIEELQLGLKNLNDNKIQVLAGWKVAIFIGALIFSAISFIINIFVFFTTHPLSFV